ncbi:unnamed protein product [Effrenium voratum]|uniref:DUF4485 domain-containing protein n=1 Tax=Effrenium voratum TaxID=2562239 RepID=A0AA36HL74_9DINO|nr:unnamed protein product [Effrenium voratum]
MAAASAAAAAAAAAASGDPLDAEFAATLRRVEASLAGAPKHLRIRGEQWAQRLGLLSKLRQPLFQKDRNLHADLLLRCIQEGTWTEPMDKHPPEGPLPSLPTHVACSLRRLRAERGIGAATKRRSLSRGKGEKLRVSDSTSLASAAAAACDASPYSASALAKRVAFLEQQNKQLRKQLDDARRASPSPSRPAVTSGGSCGVKAGVSQVRSRPHTPSPRQRAPGDARAVRDAGARGMAPLPPEDDVEAFLKYLDAFQSYAGSLFGSMDSQSLGKAEAELDARN